MRVINICVASHIKCRSCKVMLSEHTTNNHPFIYKIKVLNQEDYDKLHTLDKNGKELTDFTKYYIDGKEPEKFNEERKIKGSN